MSAQALIVNGYHGTSRHAAAAIIAGTFTLSRNEYDWLGDGLYFFQDAPHRAWEWALEYHGAEAAVVGAEISLEQCWDLLDTRYTRLMPGLYDQYLENLKQTREKRPEQRGGAHRLDRHVINYAVDVLAENGIAVTSVRAAFQEGRPIYPDSALYDKSHVQIVVREPERCLRRVWMEDIPREFER